MADRSSQPAVLRRRVELLEALLAAEKAAHAKTFENYRENLWKLVELEQRHARAMKTMAGDE